MIKENIRKAVTTALPLIFAFFCASAVRAADVMTIYSDNGALGDKVNACGNTPVCVWPSDGSAVFKGSSTALSINPEGYNSFQTQSSAYAGAGWGVFFDTVTLHPGGLDFSRFVAGGELRFWIYTPTVNFITFNMETTSGAKPGPAGFYTTANQWVLISTPVSSFATVAQAQQLYSPFEISSWLPGTYYIDNVRYVTPSAPGAEVFSVGVYNISDQQPVANQTLTWGTVAPGSDWNLSNQYIL